MKNQRRGRNLKNAKRTGERFSENVVVRRGRKLHVSCTCSSMIQRKHVELSTNIMYAETEIYGFFNGAHNGKMILVF